MLKVDPATLTEIAKTNGWLHTSGRLAGTINTSAMALGLGVSKSTVNRAYDGGAAGLRLIEALHEISGVKFDDLLSKAVA